METTIRKTANFFAPGGIKKASYTLGIGIVCAVLDWDFFTVLAVACASAILYWHYQPNKVVPDLGDSGIASPIDGKVVSIETLQEEEYGYRICIEGSYFNKGTLYAPLSGSFSSYSLRRGSRLSEDSRLFESLNERFEVTFSSKTRNVKCEHTLKKSIFDLHVGFLKKREVSVGDYYGFALNTRTYIYLPKCFRLNVRVGSKVTARQNIIGYFSS